MNPGFRTWAAACAAGLWLAACGGGGSGGGGATPTPTTPTTPATSNVSLLANAPSESVAASGATQITVTISNTGAATATGVVFTPNLAAGLTLASYTCTGASGGACPATATPAASIPLPDLPAKASLALVLSVNVAEGASGTLSSMPAVVAGNDATTTDNSAAAVLKAYTADVSISGSAPAAPVAAGTTAAYTMTVSNAGPDEARDVLIANTLGSFQTLGTLSCSASGGATCPTATGATMRVPLLPKNGSLVFTVPATVAAGVSGSIANLMMVTSAGDPVATNNAAAVQLSAYVPAPPATAPQGQSSITLQSDGGDYIGDGRSYSYTRANANLSVSAEGGKLTVVVSGDQNWRADFQQPSGIGQIQPGSYGGLARYPFHVPTAGGLNWSGEGRGCNTLTGSFTVT
ncbi:MAG: DUF11 domain-containing protein, partial [Rubrivivax sp.]